MSAHDFYLYSRPLDAAVARAKKHGWRAQAAHPHWFGYNLLWHDNTPKTLVIHPLPNTTGRAVCQVSIEAHA